MGEQSTRCPACGTEPRAGARYCDGCGGALPARWLPAEYKQVTVLFADVTHSMDIAARVGPERLREIMSDLFDRSTTVVRRFGGTVDKFIGDGVMALFGAPVALEDHALRACLAALEIQAQAGTLAVELAGRDGVDFKVRVGLNSGEVIAGEIGSNSTGYTVIGEQVGLAQRMESAAQPGGVMLSATTARLVEHTARLGDIEWVQIKGATRPMPAHRLIGIVEDHRARRGEAALVGRHTEITDIADCFERAVSGNGAVVALVGPPGIGKSRITREVAATAAERGVDVFWSYCQSHAGEVPFHAATELLRSVFGVEGQTAERARATTRSALPLAHPDDLRLLDDMLGIGDGQPEGATIDPDARKRRLTALLNSALASRSDPAVYVIEDAHWIDSVSEAMLAGFLGAVTDSPTLVLVTHRPEYSGALHRSATSIIRLDPLDHDSAAALTETLVGHDGSVRDIARRIAERAAGNPFFLEEIVRDLAERGVLNGHRGAYTCDGVTDLAVPATVQATIAARIDRLGPVAKRTLNAAAVIGSPFSQDLLKRVLDEEALLELTHAELIAPVSAQPVQFAFRHPLMRAVAYESQLKSGRAQLHRAIAAAIEHSDLAATPTDAALIATHLEAAGDLRRAYDWHMGAGTRATHRDIAAARISWQRAVAVADRLPAADPDRPAMRIAPRTLLCATIWRVGGELEDVKFDELRELTSEAGDKRSLAIGMTGLVQMMNFHGEYSRAAQLATELANLLETIGDAEMTVGLMSIPIVAKWDVGEMSEAMRLAQRAIDLSQGDPEMGNLIIGSPLAFALVLRASAASTLGIDGWKEDYNRAVEMARAVDKFTFFAAVMFKYIAVENWALLADDAALRETAEALELAHQFGDDFSLTTCEFIHGTVLVRRPDRDHRQGFGLLARAKQRALEHRHTIISAWCADLDVAAEKVRTADFDTAIDLCRNVLDEEIRSGEMMNRGWCTTVLVQALVGRGRVGDLQLAQDAIDRLAAMPTEPVYLYHELPLLRLRALLARAEGNQDAYIAFRDRYRERAAEVGFDGHIALARAMD